MADIKKNEECTGNVWGESGQSANPYHGGEVELGEGPFYGTSLSSSVKWGDDSHPVGGLGGLKELWAPCLANSRCSIIITSKDEPPECAQALHT